MVNKTPKSNVVSYFDLKSPSKSKQSKNQSPSRSRSKSPKRKLTNQEKSAIRRSKSLEVRAVRKGGGSTTGKSQSLVKSPVRTGNIPKKDAQKKSTEKKRDAAVAKKDPLDARFRGKKVLIFKNGNDSNLVEEPLPLAVSEHSYPTFDSLIEYLNRKLTLHSGRINKLYKIQGGEIRELNQLRDKGWYVASNGPYVPPEAKDGDKKPISKKFIYGSKKGLKNDKKGDKNKLQASSNKNGESESEYEYEEEKSPRRHQAGKLKSPAKKGDKNKLHPTSNKLRNDESESEYEDEDEVENLERHRNGIRKTASADKSYRKPPVPKVPGQKKRALNFHDESESVEKSRSSRISKEKRDLPFGRMGTLGPYIRSHRPGSLKGNKKPDAENDEIVTEPLERSLSSQSAKRKNSTKFEYDQERDFGYGGTTRPRSMSRGSSKENFRSGSRTSLKDRFGRNNNYDDNNWREEENRKNERRTSFGRDIDSAGNRNENEEFENRRNRSPPHYGRVSRESKKMINDYAGDDDPDWVREPSEFEPINKVMYPSGYRPPSRKDAASSAKALQHDVALSAKIATNGKNGERAKPSNSADYDDDYRNESGDDDFMREQRNRQPRSGWQNGTQNGNERQRNGQKTYSPINRDDDEVDADSDAYGNYADDGRRYGNRRNRPRSVDGYDDY